MNVDKVNRSLCKEDKMLELVIFIQRPKYFANSSVAMLFSDEEQFSRFGVNKHTIFMRDQVRNLTPLWTVTVKWNEPIHERTNCQPVLTTFLQPRHIPTQGYNITQSSAPDDGHTVARNMLSNYKKRNKEYKKWHLVGFSYPRWLWSTLSCQAAVWSSGQQLCAPFILEVRRTGETYLQFAAGMSVKTFGLCGFGWKRSLLLATWRISSWNLVWI